MDEIIHYISHIDEGLWTYLCLPMVLIAGLYLTIRSKFFQILSFPSVIKLFLKVLFSKKKDDGRGLHPIAVFFTAIGGCIGIGNVVGICIAVQLGGPGAVFWIWIGGLLGMVITYSEVFLGIKFRIPNLLGGYDGGPMYFLKHAFKVKWIPILVAFLLCIYGIEIFMFRVMVESISDNWEINYWVVVGVLLFLILFAGKGGIVRVAKYCSAIMPLFLILFISMGLYVFFRNIEFIPQMFATIFGHAFTPHAAVGGFLGGSIVLTMRQGIERGCYSGDTGIGYASIVHSESSESKPSRQAGLAVFGVFLDTFVICTMSVLLVIITDVWHTNMSPQHLVQEALATEFPYMSIFMPSFLFLLGYSTMIAFFFVGLKCARFLSPRWGQVVYYIYAVVVLLLVSIPSVNMTAALSIMQIAGGLLLLINISGVVRLRKEIVYRIEDDHS